MNAARNEHVKKTILFAKKNKHILISDRFTDSTYAYQVIGNKIDKKISIATVYRTVKLLEESGIVEKHDFKGGKARYEESPEEHHDHLIDINSGEIIEFVDKEIEELQIKVAQKLGYKLVDHKLELYGSKIKK